jgi:hypothetical protein
MVTILLYLEREMRAKEQRSVPEESVLREFDLIKEVAKNPNDPAELDRVRQGMVFNFYKHGFAAYFGCAPDELEDRLVLLLTGAVLTKPVTDSPN